VLVVFGLTIGEILFVSPIGSHSNSYSNIVEFKNEIDQFCKLPLSEEYTSPTNKLHVPFGLLHALIRFQTPPPWLGINEPENGVFPLFIDKDADGVKQVFVKLSPEPPLSLINRIKSPHGVRK